MNIFGHAAGSPRPRSGKQILVPLLSLALLFATWPQNLLAYQDEQVPMPPAQPASAPPAPAPAYTQQTPEQLQQLVAPIALYPDSLVAQILAASTFPSKSSRPTDGCKSILICRATLWVKLWTSNPGTRASRRSPHFHPCLEIWTRTSPGRHR